MKILAQETIRANGGRCMLLAGRKPGDPLVSLYARLWMPGETGDDAPEIRVRCKADQLDFFWGLAVEQARIILTAAA